jgi:hypothetical protein
VDGVGYVGFGVGDGDVVDLNLVHLNW